MDIVLLSNYQFKNPILSVVPVSTNLIPSSPNTMGEMSTNSATPNSYEKKERKGNNDTTWRKSVMITLILLINSLLFSLNPSSPDILRIIIMVNLF